MDVPGRTGISIFGDESLELWRDPLGYVNKRVKEHGSVFAGRILNKPTIFLTSSAAVRDMLCGEWEREREVGREVCVKIDGRDLVESCGIYIYIYIYMCCGMRKGVTSWYFMYLLYNSYLGHYSISSVQI